MSNQPPKVHIDDVERVTMDGHERFGGKLGRIGAQLGMKKIGCSVVELKPGQKAWPLHLHFGLEELFIVLEGHGTLRYDEGEFPIGAGEIFFAGTGQGTAHQIVNTSDAQLKYLALSSMGDPEICYYPDSKKYGSYSWGPDGKRMAFMAHEDSRVGYYDGE